MVMEAIWFEKSPDGPLKAQARSPKGRKLTLTGQPGDLEPAAEGDVQLVGNMTLQHNLWAYAGFRQQASEMVDDEASSALLKKAEVHAKVAQRLTVLIDELGNESRVGWCSNCIEKSTHHKVKSASTQTSTYICDACGSATDVCVAPRCKNMAVRSLNRVHLPSFCAEHSHTLPSFERARDPLERLEDFASFMEYDKPNLAKGSKLGLTAVLAVGAAFPLALMAAPAVGGAVGVLASKMGAGAALSGAAAQSFGLALLGGGSVAAGGLGMAGGTMVVTAVGAALGGALGASVTNAYLRDDKSFKLELFREGSGTPVIIARGFTTEGDIQWWKSVGFVEQTYPDQPIYFLHWGSKELNDVALLLGSIGGAQAGRFAVGAVARKASKAAAGKLSPLMPVMVATDLAKNPWHVARVRADKTGVILGDILARFEGEAILVGHSLGGRVMATATQTLSKARAGKKVRDLRILGAAIGQKFDWASVASTTSGYVVNYFSRNDAVLRNAYAVAEVGSVAVGLKGTGCEAPNLVDVDVSDTVPNHNSYWENITGEWKIRV
ncbi:DUF726 domain-containing protein [Dietzia sp. NPDC055343]